MKTDSYSRFLKSDLYKAQMVAELEGKSGQTEVEQPKGKYKDNKKVKTYQSDYHVFCLQNITVFFHVVHVEAPMRCVLLLNFAYFMYWVFLLYIFTTLSENIKLHFFKTVTGTKSFCTALSSEVINICIVNYVFSLFTHGGVSLSVNVIL